VEIREEPDDIPKRKQPFTPPRNNNQRKPPTPIRDQPSLPEMRQSIEDFYVLAGTLFLQVPNPRTRMVGTSVISNAEKCAESIIEAAKKDPRLRRVLVKLTTAGVYSGIFIAHTPIIMAAYVAFQAPDSAFIPPETVEAEPTTNPFTAA
jgi:hypothetical protein